MGRVEDAALLQRRAQALASACQFEAFFKGRGIAAKGQGGADGIIGVGAGTHGKGHGRYGVGPLRGPAPAGVFEEYPREAVEIGGKTIYKTRIPIQKDDTFIAFSDGAIHAGIGMSLNFGWERKDIIDYMEMMYDESFTAKTLNALLLDECNKLYGGQPGDDTTAVCVKVRERCCVNLMIGPPSKPEDLAKMHEAFFSAPGKRIVCGGTTSTLAAEYLKKPIIAQLDYLDSDIPPTAKVEGLDLVTEGVITMSKVVEYAKDYLEENRKYSQWGYKRDGASMIARMLFEEATDINFFVGRAVNPAHQNPNLPINFNIKMQLVENLCTSLEKMGKKVKVSYF